MKYSSFFLNIHNFIKVSAPNLSLEDKTFLCGQLEQFVSKTPIAHDEADIVILELEETIPITKAAEQMDALYGFWVTQYQDEISAVFFHKGSPDIIAVFSNPIKIFYKTRSKIGRKLHGVLVFCIKFILGYKNLFFCHGAVLEKDGCATLLIGQRGIKKTILTLTMLKHGWNYLTDDKAIFQKGTAFQYQSSLSIRDNHFDELPWLADIGLSNKSFKKRAALRKTIRTLARKYIHKKLLPAEDGLLNPNIKLNVNTQFPECKVLTSATPSTVIMMHNAPHLNVDKVSKNNIIDDFVLIQKLAYAEFGELELMLSLYDKRAMQNMRKLIETNLDAQHFYKVTLPIECDINLIYAKVLNCLKPVL